MAITKCKECGSQVSTKAKACPACGASVKRRAGLLGWLFCIVVVLPIAWSFGTSSNKAPATQSAKESANAIAPTNGWEYGEIEDKMTGKPIKYARLQSVDRAFFDFPYKEAGGSSLAIILRKSERSGEEAFLAISKGQIVCGTIDCSVNIKFGDGEVRKVPADRASAGSSDTVFFENADDVKKGLIAGDPLKVELQFYKAGSRTFSFNTHGLKWD